MSIKRYDSQKFIGGMFVIAEKVDGKFVLHSDYAELEAKCAALAAENAGLKNFISEECLVRNPSSRNQLCAEDVSDALAPETPATDAFLAEVRAQGVKMFAEWAGSQGAWHRNRWVVEKSKDYTAQLRQDANTAELVAAGIITRIEG